MTEESFEAFADWLSGQARKATGLDTIPRATIFDMGNGMCAYVERLTYHWTLKTSVIGDRIGCEGRWCYEGESPLRVLRALSDWKDAGWAGEPAGWRRHPQTGRRRNDDGDPSTEELRW